MNDKSILRDFKYILGIDIGSVSVNFALLTRDKEILWTGYYRTHGKATAVALEVIETELQAVAPLNQIAHVAVTGAGGHILADILKTDFVNEVISHASAVQRLHPEAVSVIDMGGEDSKLIQLRWDEGIGETVIDDFAMNSLCAAGTGSFLDQQANRLGISIEGEFGEMALKSKRPPRIAGRCSVFAKSDMIHLQQIATPDYDIVAGLCYAVARNFKSSIAKGHKIEPPVVFQGGVAANKGMGRAVKDVLGLDEGELIIPEHYGCMGAIGAALIGISKGSDNWIPFAGIEPIRSYLQDYSYDEPGMERLAGSQKTGASGANFSPADMSIHPVKKGTVIDAFLGIDIGSISTNLVVTDEQRRVLARRYLMTAGRPIEAVRTGLREIGTEIGDKVNIVGVCTTGSGRYLIGDFVGADLVRNEITAQATAAIALDPDVDTIFEIGGQDSKFISINKGAVVDFEMNKVCAAGTGSFLEEQAEKLGINIKEEFGDIAMKAPEPVRLGDRCTVFMESDLVRQQQKGAEQPDLIAGLAYSIVQNYLTKVVVDGRIGDKIFFQGGVANNRAVVAAFEKVTGKPIIRPPHFDVTGAIGCCILAQEARQSEIPSQFKGFDLSDRSYTVTTFTCRKCENHCEIRRVKIENEPPMFYGHRCELYDVKKNKPPSDLPDLFIEREEKIMRSMQDQDELGPRAPTMGIPRSLHTFELLPLWSAFFNELGFRIVLSPPTSSRIIQRGVEAMAADTCFPVKVAHGHILELLDMGADYIFLPSITHLFHEDPNVTQSLNCPYVQGIPYMARATLPYDKYESTLLEPVISFQDSDRDIERQFVSFAVKQLGQSRKQAKKAFRKGMAAQQSFYSWMKKRGREILDSMPENRIGLVIVARAYNGCDKGLNMDLPRKLREMGVQPIPIDFLPLDSAKVPAGWENMYWKYGQRFILAAEFIVERKNLFPIYLTNFGCGPDSFIQHFFDDGMRGKPYLVLELDEHSADAGLITRCEAFLDSLKAAKNFVPGEMPKEEGTVQGTMTPDRKVYIPYMSDHAYVIQAALNASGIQAEVMPESTLETVELGKKYTTGRECYPNLLTTGDMIRVVQNPDFDPDHSAFFMPTAEGPCRFGQYARFQRKILNGLGFSNVPIISTNAENSYGDIPGLNGNFRWLTWRGIVACDLLSKLLMETRPYEEEKGSTDRVYGEALKRLSEAIRTNGGVSGFLEEAVREFEAIPQDRTEQRPVIGMVGEIYIRTNEFSNSCLIRSIEDLGGEVWLAPIQEWILYTNYQLNQKNKKAKKFIELTKSLLTDLVQQEAEHFLTARTGRYLNNPTESPIADIIGFAEPYISDTLDGEAILSVGKAIDYIQMGLSGIVNTMPFTCMPGNIVTTVSKKIRENTDGFPWLNIAFDGGGSSNLSTRLEAFIHQARQYKNRRSSAE